MWKGKDVGRAAGKRTMRKSMRKGETCKENKWEWKQRKEGDEGETCEGILMRGEAGKGKLGENIRKGKNVRENRWERKQGKEK